MNQFLRAEDFPNFGTLGEIAYTLGRVHRNRQHFESARAEFNDAVNLYEERARRKAHSSAQANDRTFNVHKVATITALGLSYCNYATGALSTALYSNLAPARLLLEETGDIINRKYADVIHAMARRALEGRERTDFERLERMVHDAAATFDHYHHWLYLAGAYLELGFIKLGRRQYEKALEWCDAADQLEVKDSFRWKFGALLVRSYALRQMSIEAAARGEEEKAKRLVVDSREEAEKALALAENAKSDPDRINALMVRALTHGSANVHSAIKDLEDAKNLNLRKDRGRIFRNPRIHGECCLRLAASYAAVNQLQDARVYFKAWLEVRPVVENARLNELAQEAEGKIFRGRKLTIDLDHDGWWHKDLEKMVRRFLLLEAGKQRNTVPEVGELLGIPRPSVYTWVNECGGDDAEVKALKDKLHIEPRKQRGKKRKMRRNVA